MNNTSSNSTNWITFSNWSSGYNQWVNPEVYITRNKNRYKQYSNPPIYYLANNTEFEIELYNPNLFKVKVDIELNGACISDCGFIILPGQRIFLDRFINQTNKFIFKTYKINKNDTNADAIIKLNGLINLKFYKEQSINYMPLTTSGTTTITTSYNSGMYVPPTSGKISTITCNLNDSKIEQYNADITTGRIDISKNKSDIEFTADYSMFEFFPRLQTSIKLLPDDQAIKDYTKIKHYCVNCGIRVRNDKWNYCPKCGQKL